MRGRIRALCLFTILLLTGVVVSAPAEAAPKTPRTAECQGDWLPATPTSEDIMSGRIDFVGLPPVKVGENVNWHLDPYKNRSWSMVFHSLRWMGRLVSDYESSGKTEYLDRAIEIAKDWVKDNPRGGARTSQYAWAEHPIALRAPALVCLSKHVKADWLTRSLSEHAVMLSNPALYEKGHNHGLDQDIALLRIGCRYGNAKWKDLALRRMTGSVKLDIDSQGALQEQAPRYGVYVHERLAVALDAIEQCGLKTPAEITKRWQSLEAYVTHATQPDGFMVPIGDGPADVRPSGYAHEKKTVKVFRSGYVFGRTAWDEEESAFYSIRFGPALKFHGHEDHLGVTYYAQGHDVLVEAGFHSYENTPYRYWTMSPEAHNVPVVEGARFRGGTATSLVRSTLGKERQSFKLTDQAYGVPRTRSVLVNHEEDLMAVLDTVPSGSKVRDLWHFAAGLEPISNSGGKVVVGDKKWRATLVQLAMPSCERIDGQSVRIGQTNPYQGWVSPAYMQKEEAAAVISPASASLLTVIVPGTDAPGITCSGGKVKVHTSNGTVSFRATASGDLF